jgi:IclR family transcriptional regulator, pca regulon regulatory protein
MKSRSTTAGAPDTANPATVAEPFEKGPDYVQSLARGLAVLRALGVQSRPMTLSAVASASGLSRAVARRQLLTLAHLGYVRQDGRDFALTARVLELGFAFLGSLAYPELARAPLQALAGRVHESCSLGVLEGTDVVYMQRVAVNKLMSVALGIGSRLPAWCTSMGRVLLGALPEAELEKHIAASALRRLTPHTCSDPQELLRRIRQARADDYAYVDQELERGLCSLAVPLRNPAGQVVAALNVGMAYRENARGRALAEILPELRATAAEIERTAGALLPARLG